MKKILAAFFCLFIFSCTTLLPEYSINNGLLIIQRNHDFKDGINFKSLGRYFTLTIYDSEGEKKQIEISPGINSVPLKPGSYVIKELHSIPNAKLIGKGSKESIKDVNLPFFIEKGFITILPYSLNISMYKEGNDIHKPYELVSLSQDDTDILIGKLKDSPNYQTYDGVLNEEKLASGNTVAEENKPETSDENSGYENNVYQGSADKPIQSRRNEQRMDAPIVTVFDFDYEGISEMESNFLVDYLGGALFDTGNYRIIDRTQREAILSEIKFSLSGCTDESCQLEAGKLLAADYMVVGSLGKVGSRFIINAKLIDIESGETVLSARGIFPDVDAMLDGCNELAVQLSVMN